jgi:hypothetical protein
MRERLRKPRLVKQRPIQHEYAVNLMKSGVLITHVIQCPEVDDEVDGFVSQRKSRRVSANEVESVASVSIGGEPQCSMVDVSADHMTCGGCLSQAGECVAVSASDLEQPAPLRKCNQTRHQSDLDAGLHTVTPCHNRKYIARMTMRLPLMSGLRQKPERFGVSSAHG